MSNKYKELINGFESRFRTLISEYKQLQEQNQLLRSELERKQNDLMQAHSEVLELRKKYDDLRTARNLGVTDGGRDESRQRIHKMVREIDKCLALLNE